MTRGSSPTCADEWPVMSSGKLFLGGKSAEKKDWPGVKSRWVPSRSPMRMVPWRMKTHWGDCVLWKVLA